MLIKRSQGEKKEMKRYDKTRNESVLMDAEPRREFMGSSGGRIGLGEERHPFPEVRE